MESPLTNLDPEILKRERSLSILDRIYWAYYIHLPFYLMTTGEAFVLHLVMFLFTSLIIYGVGVYLPSSTLSLCTRMYYYITGEDLHVSIREHLPYFSKQYLSYIDNSWVNITRYIENMIS